MTGSSSYRLRHLDSSKKGDPQRTFRGAAVVAEGTYGTDPAIGYAWVHCIPGSSPTPRKERMERESLGFVPEASPPFKTLLVEGELKMHLNMSDAIVGVILRACGIRTGAAAPFLYTIAGTSAGHPRPRTASRCCSITGCRP